MGVPSFYYIIISLSIVDVIALHGKDFGAVFMVLPYNLWVENEREALK